MTFTLSMSVELDRKTHCLPSEITALRFLGVYVCICVYVYVYMYMLRFYPKPVPMKYNDNNKNP